MPSDSSTPAISPEKALTPVATSANKNIKSNGNKNDETKEGNNDATIFTMISDIEKSISELQDTLSNNEKDFLSTLKKIEEELNTMSKK